MEMDGWRHGLGKCMSNVGAIALTHSSLCPLNRAHIQSPQQLSGTWALLNNIISSLQGFGSGSRGIVRHRDPDKPLKLLVVQPRIHPKPLLRTRLLEALRLADSLHGLREGDDDEDTARSARARDREKRELPPFVLVHSPHANSSGLKKHISAGAYLGPGTIEIVRAHANAINTKDELDAVFVNAPLSGVQQRNLERAWGRPVLDRVGLIIEIFGAHARTKEARLQVELAALEYKKSRLVRIRGKRGRLGFGLDGEAEVVSARGRGTGGRGFISGAGETEIQLQRRRIAVRRRRLTLLLSEVHRTRSLHRAARRRHGISQALNAQGLPLIAVVGYTNAGKSSLVSALSRSRVYVDDRLFATLDPQVRSVVLPSGQKVLLSDTVGFISDLPIQLVEAFHATLEEVLEADILLHVIDSSAANADEQRSSVLKVLEEIGVPKEKLKTQVIEAWNKVDLTNDDSILHGAEDTIQLEAVGDNLPLSSSQGNLTAAFSVSELADSAYLSSSDESTLEQDEIDERVSIWGAQILDGEVTRVATSALKGTGLPNLLQVLDNYLKKAKDYSD